MRIASLGYQKGFGGHFHNDNSIGALRDIPGVVIATPSNGADAVRLLRTCFALAVQEGAVVLFIEPIALYPIRDLHTEGDGGWLRAFPDPGDAAEFGRARVHGAEGAADLLAAISVVGLLEQLGGQGIVFGEVTGVHMRDDCLVDGVFDVTRFQPLARLGYRDYARVTELFSLSRPGE